MEFLKQFSELPVAPISDSEIEELSKLFDISKNDLAESHKSLISHLCTQILDQIKRDKAPSFSSIRESKIALYSLNTKDPAIAARRLPKKPRYYQFETLASCNAGCSFCPYTTMARKGAKMSDETIDNLITQISSRDPNDKFSVCTHKVSEPLLDSRLPDIIIKVLESHPKVKFGVTSNLNFVPEGFWLKLLSIYKTYGNRVSLSVSLNDSDPTRYQELMKMDQSKTLSNMRELHDICEKYFSCGLDHITVTRTSTHGMHDYEFLEFVKENFPKFEPELFKLNGWVEKDNNSINDYTQLIFGERSCKEWGRLSINAEGNASLCCMDSESIKSLGNIYTHTLEEMYNIKCQQFVPVSLERKDSISPCSSCNYPSIV